jgi:protein required for attachment to host cells
MKHPRNWLLLADGRRARVYHYLGPEQMPEAEPDLNFEREDAPSRDILTDRPGRMQPGVGTGADAFAPRVDPHEQAEERFLDEVAAKIAAAVDAGRCDAIILAAPPKALGHLRRKLSPGTQKLIRAEIDKDLTKIPRQRLGKLVADHLGE